MDLPEAMIEELPESLRANLEPCCFAPVSEGALRLGESFDAHVVSYRESHGPVSQGKVELCRMLAMAELDRVELERLRRTEKLLGVTLVAYAKPIQLR